MDDFVAEAINDFALLVHYVVVFQRAFALLEIVLLDPLLRRLDGTIEQRMFKLLPFFETDALHDFHDAVRTEEPHEIVFERDKEMRRTRIALARATST